MNRQSGWLTKVLPFPSDDIRNTETLASGYNSFRRGLCAILLVLVLVPLIIISVLSHNQYRQLLEDEELDQLVLNLEESQSTIEAFISELTSVVKFVASGDCHKNVLDSENLKKILVRLQNEYPGFVDIQVVDSNGTQKAYAGPYHLKNYNYSSQIWFQEVLERGVSISSVFTGFRNIPHFVIAVSRNPASEDKKCVVRVTINASTLQEFVNTINSGYADDLFLVDSERIAQTTSQKYGGLGSKCTLHDTGRTDHSLKGVSSPRWPGSPCPSRPTTQESFQGRRINHAVADLADTPWKLVLVKEQYLHAKSWVLFKIRLVTIFLSCAIVAVFVIVEISHALTAHIRESDRKRQQLYSEAESSNKLASIGRLAAGVAHEINNPLSIINQKTGLVQDFMEMTDDFAHKGAMAEALGGIQSSVERCKIITHRLLGFARQTDVDIEEIDVNDTMREVVEFLAKEAAYNQIKLEFNLSPDIHRIWSSRGPLQQVFLNIINNAIDAIGSGGTISLASRQINDNLIQITRILVPNSQ